MVETGAKPQVSGLRSLVSKVGRALTNPLLPDDYFALIKPTWSTRELTATVVKVRREHGNAATVVIKPDFAWPDHGLIVETDGRGTHDTFIAFTDDREPFADRKPVADREPVSHGELFADG